MDPNLYPYQGFFTTNLLTGLEFEKCVVYDILDSPVTGIDNQLYSSSNKLFRSNRHNIPDTIANEAIDDSFVDQCPGANISWKDIDHGIDDMMTIDTNEIIAHLTLLLCAAAGFFPATLGFQIIFALSDPLDSMAGITSSIEKKRNYHHKKNNQKVALAFIILGAYLAIQLLITALLAIAKQIFPSLPMVFTPLVGAACAANTWGAFIYSLYNLQRTYHKQDPLFLLADRIEKLENLPVFSATMSAEEKEVIYYRLKSQAIALLEYSNNNPKENNDKDTQQILILKDRLTAVVAQNEPIKNSMSLLTILKTPSGETDSKLALLLIAHQHRKYPKAIFDTSVTSTATIGITMIAFSPLLPILAPLGLSFCTLSVAIALSGFIYNKLYDTLAKQQMIENMTLEPGLPEAEKKRITDERALNLALRIDDDNPLAAETAEITELKKSLSPKHKQELITLGYRQQFNWCDVNFQSFFTHRTADSNHRESRNLLNGENDLKFFLTG